VSKTLEILIYGEVGENFWTGEGITPKSIKKAIDSAGAVTDISVRINSPGGVAFDGVAIYNLLRAQGKPVSVKVDGIAASAASIIAMAGDTVAMGKGAMMMVHDPMLMTIGNAAEFRAAADLLDTVADSMADIYVARTGKPKDEVRSIMATETWLSAQDAVEQGFATELADGSTDALAAARLFPLLAKLKNVPDALRPPGGTEEPASEAAKQEPPADSITVIRERFSIKHKRRS
jgi:ATP-dependent Clp protease protease subunit